jgi:L-rhamnose isomerase
MTHDLSLSNPDDEIRRFWINHVKASRRVAHGIGKALGKPCVNNIWIPDGFKDNPADRLKYRKLLKDSLDEIFAERFDDGFLVDALEGKLFGIGTECYVTGSNDFYLAYAAKNGTGICLDSGHFHPTEVVSDKLSSASLFFDDILLHVSRGVRWDSDHVVVMSDELQSIFTEIARADIWDKVHIGLDYFDASINRLMAWGVGLRAAGRAALNALLEPTALIKDAEDKWDLGTRLALTEEFKNLPSLAVWNMACLNAGVPIGSEWVDDAKAYEDNVCLKRK